MYLFGIKSWGVGFSVFGWLIYTFHSTLALKSFPLSSSLPSFSSSSLPSSHISPVKVFQTCCVILNITNFNGQENYHVWIGDWKRCANLCGDEYLIFILVTESKTDEKKKKNKREKHASFICCTLFLGDRCTPSIVWWAEVFKNATAMYNNQSLGRRLRQTHPLTHTQAIRLTAINIRATGSAILLMRELPLAASTSWIIN